MKIQIPDYSLVLLIGTSGSGKSSFARKHFKPTEILSSDAFRALLSDDENDQNVTKEAFEALHYIVRQRLKLGRLCVIDATNVQSMARKAFVTLAREAHVLPMAIVFNLPERLCQERNKTRPDRDFGPHVISRQHQDLKKSFGRLRDEGFRQVYNLDDVEKVDAAYIERSRLWTDKRQDKGPFDLIGDVHGCYDELEELLLKLGYVFEGNKEDGSWKARHPEGRRALFLGDLVDRGPKNPEVLALAMAMVEGGTAICVPGNHDVKLSRKLKGQNVKISHGLAETLAQLEPLPASQKTKIAEFLYSLVSHGVFDDGKLVAAHAGLKEDMQGRASPAVRDFCLYGETTGEIDEYGLPVRYPWASEYRGKAAVVYGHTPVLEAEWVNNTICLDTGCVFGGKLTALRYPERELVSVPAKKEYYAPSKPLVAAVTPVLSTQQALDDMLNLEDVFGKRVITTGLNRTVILREENSAAALEVMSRYAANPKWLIYLPPTMSPSETSQLEGFLESPAEALDYYRNQGVKTVVCEQKHMGSRAVVIVCRDAEAARKRFGVLDGERGIVYTRTGRRFFEGNPDHEAAVLEKVAEAVTAAGFWEEFNTDWFCLDCELMPWSAKAQALLVKQYAPVRAAGEASLAEEATLLALAAARIGNEDLKVQAAKTLERAKLLKLYGNAYRQYCWTVNSVEDYKLAPFHLMASEGKVHTDKDHRWHMETLGRLCAQGGSLLLATPYKVLDLADDAQCQEGLRWWQELTGAGGEGMVVKPLSFIQQGKKGLTQPAVKCRGREYLRIIYGPEYTLEENLSRLRARGLGAKRALALSEFALGLEALERFVRKEPLRKVHECVFGVLGMESEPVDPRL